MSKKEWLDDLYRSYNHRKFVHPDPLQYLYAYAAPGDRELVSLISSSLAYGRVAQILNSVSRVLGRMGSTPTSFLLDRSLSDLLCLFKDFRHRFTTGDEVAYLLWGAKGLIERYGSLYACFMAGLDRGDETVLPALSAFVGEIQTAFPKRENSLLPSPEKGSACKRLNLFLRWMVRKDKVDPGGWDRVSPEKLMIPLDTHMHRIGRHLRFTHRNQADMRTVMDITCAFRKIAPEDPVRYDFALTRLGIRGDADLRAFLDRAP